MELVCDSPTQQKTKGKNTQLFYPHTVLLREYDAKAERIEQQKKERAEQERQLEEEKKKKKFKYQLNLQLTEVETFAEDEEPPNPNKFVFLFYFLFSRFFFSILNYFFLCILFFISTQVHHYQRREWCRKNGSKQNHPPISLRPHCLPNFEFVILSPPIPYSH